MQEVEELGQTQLRQELPRIEVEDTPVEESLRLSNYHQSKVFLGFLKILPMLMAAMYLGNTVLSYFNKDWSWSSAQGIKLIVGKKGIRVLEVGNKLLLKKATTLLGLPNDYSWIIYQRNKYGIVIDTPGVSKETKGVCNRSFKNILMLWDGYYVLPCTGIPAYFYKNRIPTGHPKQIKDELFLKSVELLL